MTTRWRKIETAPDNKSVLTYSAERCERCMPNASGMVTMRKVDGRWIVGREINSSNYVHPHHQPTHWMPLPAPPRTKS
jgi:hypothetical protein